MEIRTDYRHSSVPLRIVFLMLYRCSLGINLVHSKFVMSLPDWYRQVSLLELVPHREEHGREAKAGTCQPCCS